MQGNFGLPSVDHLIEGVHYTLVNWDFSTCEPGEKMVFGVCRKVKGQGDKEEWDTEKKSKQETQGEEAAKKAGSGFENNKPVSVGGKKYGWAKKNGKPVLVEWGSVAGTAAKPQPQTGAAPAPGAPAPTPGSAAQTGPATPPARPQ